VADPHWLSPEGAVLKVDLGIARRLNLHFQRIGTRASKTAHQLSQETLELCGLDRCGVGICCSQRHGKHHMAVQWKLTWRERERE
jgi:hypothetical protein